MNSGTGGLADRDAARRGRVLTGPLVAVAGGVVTAAGVVLPWQDLAYQLPSGTGHFVRSGLGRPEGVVVLVLAWLIVVAGLAMIWATDATRRWIPAAVAASVAVLLAWLIRVGSGAGIGSAVSALGVLACLAAIPLISPGPLLRRLRVLTVTAAAGAAGSVLLLLVLHSDVNPLF